MAPLSRTASPTPPASSADRSAATAGSTRTVGETTDAGRGRIFPCEGCGADLVFHIGVQHLKCEYCGYEQRLVLPDKAVAEQDFHGMLARLAELRKNKQAEQAETKEVRCESCGGTVLFIGTLTSSECPYCASPMQLEKVHDSPLRVPVDGVLPFAVDRKQAAARLRAWVDSLWFLPSDFKEKGEQGKFSGVYLPFWTFDTMTATAYRGERGEHYYVDVQVKVGDKTETRRERRTRWHPAAGHFDRFFDDVMAFGSRGLPMWIMVALEPWPLAKLVPFNQQMLAGFLARTYDIELEAAFTSAKERVDAEIRAQCHREIGGDEQRVHSVNSRYQAITYKHLLLPVWLLAFRYQDKLYQVAINAVTGEVQGERPWSYWKIALVVLAVAGAAALIAAIGGAIGAMNG